MRKNNYTLVAAATGHRPDKLGNEWGLDGPVSKKIHEDLIAFIKQYNVGKIVSGMAMGVDLIWAITAIKMGIPFIAAVPFKGHESRWLAPSVRLYNKVLSKASEVIYVSEPDPTGKFNAHMYQIRNIWMVNRSDILVAVWDGSDGGTANCYRYAESIDKPIHRITPWRP